MTADDPRPAGEARDLMADLRRSIDDARRPAASGGATDGEREWSLQDARRIVASIPPPTVEQAQSAALDYAETALSECWAILRRIANGDPNPRQLAIDLLDAHGFDR